MRDDVMTKIQARFTHKLVNRSGCRLWDRPPQLLLFEHRPGIEVRYVITMRDLQLFDQHVTQMIMQGCAYQGRINLKRRRR